MDEFYMNEALKIAQKCDKAADVPIGAVIVKNNKIIGKGYNKRNKKKNTLMHAEIIAINEACKKVKDWRLEGCTIYVTLEPCQMCAGAIVQARLKRVVYGASSAKSGACGSIIDILQNNEFNHQVEVTKDVLKDECSKKISEFFAKMRTKKVKNK